MQILPLSLTDFGFLLALNAIILLIAAELISPNYGPINITINKRRLKNVALVTGTLFLVYFVLLVSGIIIAK